MAENDDFSGQPLQEPDEWKRLKRIMHEHDQHRKTLKALSTVVDAAGIVKNVAPWAIIAGGALLAYLNRAVLFGGGG